MNTKAQDDTAKHETGSQAGKGEGELSNFGSRIDALEKRLQDMNDTAAQGRADLDKMLGELEAHVVSSLEEPVFARLRLDELQAKLDDLEKRVDKFGEPFQVKLDELTGKVQQAQDRADSAHATSASAPQGNPALGQPGVPGQTATKGT
jgi:chromosome segregation ATPase